MDLNIKNTIISYLSSLEYVNFAILFGSYAREQELPMSDIDIALGLHNDLTLMERGYLISELESLVHIDIDLVVLNTLLSTNPRLAYHIYQEGVLLFGKNEKSLVRLRSETMKRYLDTRYLRNQFDEKLQKELELS